jgi:hypothetical protein
MTELVVAFRKFANAHKNYEMCLARLCVIICTLVPWHDSHISPQPILAEAGMKCASERVQDGRTDGVNVLCVWTVSVVQHYKQSRASCCLDWCQEVPAERVVTPDQVTVQTESKTRLSPLQLGGHYMYHQFNIQQSTFFPHSVFMCFMWISEVTALISQYSISWLVFITEKQCVYCAVRAGSLNLIQVTLQITDRAKLTVADISPQRPGFNPGPVICGVQSGPGTGCPPNTSVFSFQYYSTNAPYLSSFTGFSYQKDKRTKSGNLWGVACFFGDTEAFDKNFLFLIMRYSIKQKSKFHGSCFKPINAFILIMLSEGRGGEVRGSQPSDVSPPKKCLLLVPSLPLSSAKS